jgi:hypothetical protein
MPTGSEQNEVDSTAANRVTRTTFFATHAEIAQQLGLSASAVQVIEQKALRKARRFCVKLGVDPRDLFGAI